MTQNLSKNRDEMRGTSKNKPKVRNIKVACTNELELI